MPSTTLNQRYDPTGKVVAVTGMGIVSPLGSDIQTFWDNLTQGKSGIDHVQELAEMPVTFGGRASGFEPERYLGGKELRHMDRYAQMELFGALEAHASSGLTPETYSPFRVGVLIGSGSGGMQTIEDQMSVFFTKGPRRVSPMTVPMFITNVGPAEVAKRLAAKGPGFSISSACATSGHALGMAARLIQAGDADCMIAGGMEACLTRFAVAAFASMRALSTRNDDPKRASRPFTLDRDGFVMAEGGAVFVLERLDKARERGARILGLIEGVGMSMDAYHMVAPDPEGTSVAYAIERALGDAGLKPTDIGYVNAHGTSTPLNDKIETLAIKKAFGEHARELLISSTKSMTGHLIGGAGGVETAICLLAMRHGVVPPTINLDNPDPECDLNYVPNRAVHADVSHCLNNTFGFGGQNVALILGKDTPG